MKIAARVYKRPPWDQERKFFNFHWLHSYSYQGNDRPWLCWLLGSRSGIDIEFWKWRFYIAW